MTRHGCRPIGEPVRVTRRPAWHHVPMDDVGDGSAETASEERVQQLLIYPDKRVVEIAPDGTVVAQESRAPNDPSLYLRDASRALRDCGSAPALYAGWRAEDRGGAVAGYAYRDAPQRRIEFSRTSILFASFAAEAFVNEFLAKRLGGNYTSEMERMRTIDKYVQLVPTVSPSITIVRGRQPGQGLARLFRVRNYLVHPKSNGCSDRFGGEGHRGSEMTMPAQQR